MRAFLNAIAAGVALTAGVISIFQNVPFMVFLKRVGATFILFYAVGALLNLAWRSALIRFDSIGGGSESEEET
ncbi:MAG: hypothetical protein GF417_00745 [Candidatus Latescibacteria bacterium]|nr:hypothetical protein [bacterium]MBD3422954.1 hypothetical protein [Candidatus Latescibacterota bacterium]